jgi:endonuclease/exonuclease/phosphatase family metal-dependent hydrolase
MKSRWLLLILPILGAVWLFNVSRPGSRVVGCFEGCAIPKETTDDGLRILSLNMLHGFPKFKFLSERLEMIASEINRLNPDIVLLQEVPWTLKTGSAAEFLAEKTGMNHAYLRANGNRWAILFEEGEVILSRYPLENLEFVVLRPRARFYENRVVLHAIAVTPLGNLDLFVTHLTHKNSEANFDQSQALKEFVDRFAGEHTLIAGDFNSLPNSPQMQIFAREWPDSYQGESSPYTEFTCCVEVFNSIPVEFYDKRIDYIYLVRGLILQGETRVFDQPVQFAGGWLWPSDHAGLMTDLIWLP